MMTATRTVLLTLALSAFVGASRITSLSSYVSIAKQNPTEDESPADNGEWETDKPGSGTEWDPRCPSVGSGAICMDCNKISVCLRGKVLPARDCPRDAPYCVNSDGFGGHCSAKPDEDREDCRSDFQCSSEGYFPDPNNCHYYYLCDLDLKAFKYDCMPGYVYDMVSRSCKRQIFSQECKKLDCSKSNGVWVYYDNNKQYYGYCYQTEAGVEEVALFKCSDGSEFDGQKCQFKCRSEGKFADSQDRSRYFECYYVGFVLQSRTKVCAKGMVFDGSAQICKPSQGIQHK
ncbi:AAEL012649-PA [Aedes aegypti]|uniref:AAEL012649-PA n=2 Tax=Aedes aegypti TaxID=7159 RepID=A0A1S4FX79_AEDAE|nr:uncharacterized protein LOC5576627 [Aedes aegypti]EAT35177.1 AAEL012649-PA [Aedes aegypti]